MKQFIVIEANALRYSIYSQFSPEFKVKRTATYTADSLLDAPQVEALRTGSYQGIDDGDEP